MRLISRDMLFCRSRWLWLVAALLAGAVKPAWAVADGIPQLTTTWIEAAAYGFMLIAAYSKNQSK